MGNSLVSISLSYVDFQGASGWVHPDFFAKSSAPVLYPRSAAGGIIYLTFGFICADEVVQVPPHRHLGKAGVGGDLFFRAVSVCIFAQVNPDMVERLPLNALFQFK